MYAHDQGVRRQTEQPIEAICREAAIQKSTFSKFMNRKGGLSIEALDRLTILIGLEIRQRGK